VSLTSTAAIGALDDDSVRCEANFDVVGELHNLGGDRRLATATSHRSSAAAPSILNMQVSTERLGPHPKG
jgi:hypothetical protein